MLDYLLFIIGLVGLYLGAEWLVKGSSKLAFSLGVKPVVLGLTIIAFGTSAPEGVVSILAAIRKLEGIAIGNVIGSNIANIGLILGLSALARPIKVESSFLRREIPIMLLTCVLLYLLSIDGRLGRIDGLLLFLGIVGFILYQVIIARREVGKEKLNLQDKKWQNGMLTIIGFGSLLFSAWFLIKSGVNIARRFGISEFVIGLTMIAVGTSLPELAISLVASLRKKSSISIGNAVGSNIFNILLVLGITSMITPIVIEKNLLIIEYPIMIGFSLLLLPFARSRFTLTRIEGLIFLLGYGTFIARLFL